MCLEQALCKSFHQNAFWNVCPSSVGFCAGVALVAWSAQRQTNLFLPAIAFSGQIEARSEAPVEIIQDSFCIAIEYYEQTMHSGSNDAQSKVMLAHATLASFADKEYKKLRKAEVEIEQMSAISREKHRTVIAAIQEQTSNAWYDPCVCATVWYLCSRYYW